VRGKTGNIQDTESISRVGPTDYVLVIRVSLAEPSLTFQHLVQTTRELLWDSSLPGPRIGKASQGIGRSKGSHNLILSDIAQWKKSKGLTRCVDMLIDRWLAGKG
jgi:hypothetical protein